MGYQQYQQGGGGGYQQRQQGGGYNQGGNQYQKSQYQTPPRKEFDLAVECEKYANVYSTLVSILEANGIAIADVKDYLGGWTTSLKIELGKAT